MPVIRFGIPTLDEMFGGAAVGGAAVGGAAVGGEAVGGEGDRGMVVDTINGRSAPTSVCIIGPAGTGKSILALHLAAYYRNDNDEGPRIIYASTDFSFSKAQKVWTDFCLDLPQFRRSPFAHETAEAHVALPTAGKRSQPLKTYPASDFWNPNSKALAYFRNQDTATPAGADSNAIVFLDLNESTAGEEWLFLNRLVAALDARSALPHLVIVDAVEGLEIFSGEHDAFGEARNRRARVAQLLRTASRKCHLVFVVEDSRESRDLPEEFITDFVLRLHREIAHGYGRRSVEIVKARGQAHWRGRHTYVIRGGQGTCALDLRGNAYQYADDPKLVLQGDQLGPSDKGRQQAYVHVFHSLHGLGRNEMRNRGLLRRTRVASEQEATFSKLRVGFGIKYLDDLLTPVDSTSMSEKPWERGLPLGTCVALIGNDGTHKGRLGRAFLSQCFDEGAIPGIGVLITTQDENQFSLGQRVAKHIRAANRAAVPSDDLLNGRLVCRRLETHDLTPAVLLHIFACAVEQAKSQLEQRALDANIPPADADRPNLSPTHPSRIRLVIDDWAAIRSAYPDIEHETLFLPTLLLYLGRQQISTLFIDTQPGSPSKIIEDGYARVLRSLIPHHIYTWHTPFFGENRIAIASLPPISDRVTCLVRELRPAIQSEDEALTVHPHFEIYEGLERAEFHRIPMLLRLYAKTQAFDRYIRHIIDLFEGTFRPVDGFELVVADPMDQYDRLRQFGLVQSDARLDHTLVFEVDECWLQTSSYTELMPLNDYLNAITYRAEVTPAAPQKMKEVDEELSRIADPFHVFRGIANASAGPVSTSKNNSIVWRRRDYFHRRGYDIQEYIDQDKVLDRVPFMWDFGFLMCRSSLWSTATVRSSEEQVKQVWERLQAPTQKKVSWREFLGAAAAVAQFRRERGEENVLAFDLDLRSTEALSCCILEIWFSEIAVSILHGKPSNTNPLWQHSNRNPASHARPAGQSRHSLVGLIDQYASELYLTLLLLERALDASSLTADGFNIIPRPAKSDAIAVRHWYSTGTIAPEKNVKDDRRPIRLPGTYTVRGDWYLGVAKGSRSERLAWQAIDLLSSLPENVLRMQEGIGLPTRDYLLTVGSDGQLSHDYLLTIPTALLDIDETGLQRKLSYGEVLKLGESEGFFWLFRSTIRNYGTHSRRWGKWLVRIFSQWESWRSEDRNASGTFALYDSLRRNQLGLENAILSANLESWRNLKDSLPTLKASLETSPSSP